MADLQISKKKIEKLFGDMAGRKFIIPDYQRPYSWTTDECTTLWEDVVEFSSTTDKEKEYFLGSVVYFKNDANNAEIIDGQQRITSLLLLLRAFYTKLQNMDSDDNVEGLKKQIEPCIWDIDDISSKVKDFSNFRLKSEVANESENQILHTILEKGETLEKAGDNYSKNYRFFLQKCNAYAQDNPLKWLNLCVTFLKRCIVLPIECADLDSALTIFSTLNNRGMPLEDADIFKAQIYKNCQTQDEKEDFIKLWKNLGQLCKESNVGLNDIFRYYTHIIRARNGQTEREIGLRSFYSQDKFKALKNENLLPELIELAEFWKLVNQGIREGDKEIVTLSFESKKYLQVMKRYPNEYWKYVVSVFFVKHRKFEQFDVLFCTFIKKLTAYYYAKFIKSPTVNSIKSDTFTFCKRIEKDEALNFSSIYQDKEPFIQDLQNNTWWLKGGLLLLKAYLNSEQKQEIIGQFEIEHIFPKKWQDTNYFGWSIEDAEAYLDTFGNLVILEKKLNIQAGNGYFGKKKEKYLESKIQEVQLLANSPKKDWLKEDIEQRQKEFEEEIWHFFNENLA